MCMLHVTWHLFSFGRPSLNIACDVRYLNQVLIDANKAGATIIIGYFDQELEKRVSDRCLERPQHFGRVRT